MYTSQYFQTQDWQKVKTLIIENPFATLVSTHEHKLVATHLPLELEEKGEKAYLAGHIARANPQWRSWAENPQEILVIIQGAHTYISSSWYDHENVSTWNYMAAHLYGSLKIIEGEALLKKLEQLTERYEQGRENPRLVANMSPNYLKNQLRALVGFEIEITHWEASFKLSQNRDDKNYHQIIEKLQKEPHPDSQRIAEAMQQIRPQE